MFLSKFCFLLLVTLIAGESNNSSTTTIATTMATQNETTITATMSTVSSNLNATSTTISSSSSLETTTVISTSTTQQPQTETNSTTETPKTVFKNRAHLNTTDYNCECDKILNICDINCCCDIDCSNEMLIAFDCTKTELNLADYYFGYGLQHCSIESSLLCVEKHNYGDDELLSMFNDQWDQQTYTWPEETPDQPIFEVENEYYVYGDPLFIYNPEKDSVETIKIPGSLTDTICQIKQPIRFLESTAVKCLKSISNIAKENSEFLTKLKNGKFFKKPLKSLSNIGETDFLNVTVKFCKYTLENCTILDFGENFTEDEKIYGYDECFQDISINFRYNLTSLSNITVHFISYDSFVVNSILEETNAKVVQKIEVVFEKLNQEVHHNFRKRLREYNQEEPLLATRLILLNETLKDQPRVLEYFQKNLTVNDLKNFTLKIPVSKSGMCSFDKNSDQINVNENSLTVCRVAFRAVEGHQTNATDFCKNFQRKIVHYLFTSLNLTGNYTAEFQDHVVISKYWTPRNETMFWTQVNLRNLPNVEVDTTNDHVTCKNLVSSVKYLIYTKKQGQKKYGFVIERVDAEFGGLTDIKVKVNEENQVKIKITVQFLPSILIKSSAQKIIFNEIFFLFSSLAIFLTFF